MARKSNRPLPAAGYRISGGAEDTSTEGTGAGMEETGAGEEEEAAVGGDEEKDGDVEQAASSSTSTTPPIRTIFTPVLTPPPHRSI
ncbi:hypothetical protein GCM10010399_79840 [Dactylosporangium fulvum]